MPSLRGEQTVKFKTLFNFLLAGKISVISSFFQKLAFPKISFRNTIRVSKSLDPDQARCFIGPDLGPNCLQRLSADKTSR